MVDVRCACDCSELGDKEGILGGEGLWCVSCELLWLSRKHLPWLFCGEDVMKRCAVE